MQCASSSLFSSLPWPEPMAGPAAPVSLSAPPAPLSLCRSSGSQVRASSSNQSGASGAVSSRNQPQGERRQSASRRVARLSCWASGGSLAQANSWNQPQGPRADLLPRKLPESSAGTQLESTVQRIKRINLKSSKRKAESYWQRSSHKNVSWFLKRNCRLVGTGKKYSKWGNARTYNLDSSIQQNCHWEWKGR